MIFVTVGAQMPFDRLTRAVDGWAAHQAHQNVIAQIGPTAFRPAAIQWTAFLEPAAFRAHIAAASLVVSHAGMGSIITALEHAKPILVMPRRGDLRETRNDHQVACAHRFGDIPGITVAMDERELVDRLDAIDRLPAASGLGAAASDELIDAMREFINAEPRRNRRRNNRIIAAHKRGSGQGHAPT